MGWKTINGDLQVRLEDGKPNHSPSTVSLEQAIEVVNAWTRRHTDEYVESWLEAAEDHLDLSKRVTSIMETDDLFRGLGPDDETTPEEAWARAIKWREFERLEKAFRDGEKAFRDGDYGTALLRFRALAESGHPSAPSAQLYMGVLCAKGLAVALNNVDAYVWFELAARTNRADAVHARTRIAERLTAEELAEARRRAESWVPR